jgi:hypothetical protein
MAASRKVVVAKSPDAVTKQSDDVFPASADLPSRAIARLQRIIEELRHVTMPEPKVLETRIKEVSPAGTVRGNGHLIKLGWPGDIPAIYRISTSTDVCKKLWSAALSVASQRKLKAQAAKKSKKEYKPPYKMARLIDYQPGRTCLYVGKTDEFTSRMREHFSPLSKSTYAMHMSLWAPVGLHNQRISIEYWPLASLNLSDPVIQALEDTMWEESNPVFGKQGPK